ncbi:DGQHR domain-containing protein [Sphingobacterium hotanense]|uniref:DGQHR domain-containing protein n=1 Tax=Sphingobacterium hotanense TaxID=649196 RepID=UPI0021A936EA|nr:DGQHR domain-containing protein [Sphingobacterium hotanense]MCT1524147.1 DGQHR domain-containing protein [Sphingobacterium hotanense]
MSEDLKIPAIKVKQWLPIWNEVVFDEAENRRKPEEYFLMFTIKAGLLKKLSKVYSRKADENRDIEIGVQRKHDPDRSKEIERYVKLGYPLSDYSRTDAVKEDLNDLRMPGWLPTAIVANVIAVGEQRGKKILKSEDAITLTDENGLITLNIPEISKNLDWNPDVPPIEIIDGQHRLWAFDPDNPIADDFEFPVVAFFNLDITWQAYLFYTINVKPKKINRSLAYDLYPLLRVQGWLDKAPETAHVYKEIRAQEIVETLWSYNGSPWNSKINMLGDTSKSIGEGKVLPNISQAAFIRNLIATFIKTTTNKGLGGLFGAKLLDKYNLPLNWNRTQQSAFIIYIWREMFFAVQVSDFEWSNSLRKAPNSNNGDGDFDDPAFDSKFSLLSSDQGVRGFMHIINDMTYKVAEEKDIRGIKWSIDDEEIKEDKIDPQDLDVLIEDIEKSGVSDFLKKICGTLVAFDWRTSSEPNLNMLQRRQQMVFKGSSGYKELRTQLLLKLIEAGDQEISETARTVLSDLGYDK